MTRLPSLRFASARLSALSAQVAVSLALAGLAATSNAQMHKVEAPEKVTRAIGVYEWTGELGKPSAMRLIPISLFINGHFEDAGAYLARPVPWVLDTGNEFFIEKAGQHEGTLDLESARNLLTMRAIADDNPMGAWYGYGKFLLPAAEPKPKALKPSRVTPSIEGSDDDSRPHMSRRNPPAVPAGSKTPSDTDPNASKSTNESTPAADSDRPTLARRSSASSAPSTDSGSGSTTTASNSSDTYDPDRPTLRHKDDDSGKKKKNNKPQGYVSGPADSLNDDPDRPRLHHGVAPGENETAPLTGMPAQLHQAVAVSDPVTHPAHIFTRAWDSPTERTEVLTALQAQARTRVTAYLAANKLTPGIPGAAFAPTTAPTPGQPMTPAASPTPGANGDSNADLTYRPVLRTKASADAAAAAAAAAAARKPATTPATAPATAPPAPATAAAKPATHLAPAQAAAARRAAARKKALAGPPQLALTGEQLSGYELSYGGLPTFIYTAEVPTAQLLAPQVTTAQPATTHAPGTHSATAHTTAAHTTAANPPATQNSTTPGPTVYVTLVAQKLPSGEFQVALASVTDANHLNRTPWMRSIDVVDPDNEHRASLLMELRAQNSRQFALYRLTGPQAEQIFVTGVIE
ncbi:hypothetical protein SAMN05421819_3660 [Bryocella elongata]|uniref:Uncharacterized protein n=1 Tax=Bryocella elongata TaxID=863522 RepID=A0A1H6BGL9_9BACT|nr:hypothetical protein [Bryocella elongata]SEG59366.1 hypothetical protein SAMN05421819_3660 [Bryocella elongata]